MDGAPGDLWEGERERFARGANAHISESRYGAPGYLWLRTGMPLCLFRIAITIKAMKLMGKATAAIV